MNNELPAPSSRLFFPLFVFLILFIIHVPSLLAAPPNQMNQIQLSFNQKPTLDAFLKLEHPTAADLLMLNQRNPSLVNINAWNKLSSDNKILFLTQQYIDDYARDVVAHASFSSGSSSLGDEQKIAELFFSKSAGNINGQRPAFVKYLSSYHVDIRVDGNVQGYTALGVLKGNNGEVNVRLLKDRFAFSVQPDGSIVLVRKGADRKTAVAHSFTGKILAAKDGSISLIRGSFDGNTVEQVTNLVIDSHDRVVARAELFGPFAFTKPTLLMFMKGDSGAGKPDRYRIQQDTRLRGFSHVIGGTFSLRGDAREPFSRRLFVEQGDEGVVDGYEIRGVNNRVKIAFEKTDFDSRASANTVFFAPDGKNVFMASAGANPYEVAADPASVIAGRKLIGQSVPFLEVPDRGYKPGDQFEPGTTDFFNLMMIQRIIGDRQTGKYTTATSSKVIAWQNAYNKRHQLQSGDAGWLSPTGRWDVQNSDAFFQEASASSTMIFRPSGGTVAITEGATLSVQVKGKVSFSYGNEQYDHLTGRLTRKKTFFNPVSPLPVSIVAYDDAGKQAAIVTREGNKNSVFAFNQGFMSGENCLPCFIAANMDLSQVECAGFVRRLARLEGGYYQAYGLRKQSFDLYTGQYGNAWEISENIRDHGGTSLYWKEAGGDLPLRDPRLAAQVSYDFGSFKEGDVISMYFTGSNYLDESFADGKDGRQNTHVAKVLGTTTEVLSYDPSPGSLGQFLKKELGVQNPTLLANFPVWVKKEDDSADAYQRVRLHPDGNYYDGSGHRVVPGRDTVVKVEKIIIAQLWHQNPNQPEVEAVRQEDFGRFLDDNPSFSLYEHLRPNEKRMADASANNDLNGVQAMQLRYNTIEEELQARQVPERDIPALAKSIKLRNAMNAPKAGDVLFVSRTSPYEEERAEPSLSLSESLEKQGVDDAETWRTLITKSTEERMREYPLAESDAQDFELLTLSVGLKESGLTDSVWGYHKAKKQAEDAAALLGSWAPDFSYGYYQLLPENAQQNAAELSFQGVIPKNDFDGPRELTGKEGAVKHGQRQLAKLWTKYVTPDMDRQQKIQLVAAAYNCGEWCPRNAAFQQQFNDIAGTSITPDGRLGDQTVDSVTVYAQAHGIEFKREDILASGTLFEQTPLYQHIKEQWRIKNSREPAYGTIPAWPYGAQVMNICRELSARC